MSVSNGRQCYRFQNRIALVVGGAQGIGKAISVALAREGASLVIGDIDSERLCETTKEIETLETDICAIRCDVRQESEVVEMVRRTVEKHQRIDILMYIAGVSKAEPFATMTSEHWDWIVDTNLRGAFLVSRCVIPHMISRGQGKLVFMASTNSLDAEAGLAPYNASKAGVWLLAKTLARELGPHGITSNAIGPGFIRTRLTEPFLQDPAFTEKYTDGGGVIPLGRLGVPDDVVGPALFLASSESDYVNGVLLFVDGGQLA